MIVNLILIALFVAFAIACLGLFIAMVCKPEKNPEASPLVWLPITLLCAIAVFVLLSSAFDPQAHEDTARAARYPAAAAR